MISNVDLEAVSPRPSDWLALSGEYTGRCRAEFSNPKGTIEGDVRATFDESGDLEIVMTVDSLECPDRDLKFGLDEFLSGESPTPHGTGFTMGTSGDFKNPCESLEIKTQVGELWAKEKILYWLREISLSFEVKGRTICFKPLRPIYDSNSGGSPAYWVIPLFNYFSEFCPQCGPLDNHALRIFKTPTIPPDVIEPDCSILRLKANSRNRLIVFTFNNGLGFIEALPDYEERERKFLEGPTRLGVTSVMIGEVGQHSIDPDQLEDWFPFDFVSLLGLSSGNQVGAPWFEFRTVDGQLVRRVHLDLGKPNYLKGIRSINELVHRGTGALLSLTESSRHWKQSYFRVALKQLLTSGLNGFPIEDQMSHLFRALDALRMTFVPPRMIQDPRLSDASRKIVEDAMTQTLSELKSHRQAEGVRKDSPEAKALERIEQMMKNATKIDEGFGKGVLALMKFPEFALCDGDVVLKHGEAKPWPGNRSWPQALSRYRGIVMHQGYFDFRAGDDLSIIEMFWMARHLHDIVVRMILKMLGYQGTYQPSVLDVSAQIPLDWVTPDTSPSKLGYSR